MRGVLINFALAWIFMLSGAGYCLGGPKLGIWGANTIRVFSSLEDSNPTVTSPGDKLKLTVTDFRPFIQKSSEWTKRYLVPDIEIAPPLTEIGWSNDSKSFFFNLSDGGAVGTWSVRVFQIASDGVKEIPIDGSIANDFSIRFDCTAAQESANFAGIKWTRNDTALLIVGEVPPHSGCKYMGMVVGYEYSFHEKRILKNYPEPELIRHFGRDLGQRLRDRFKLNK